MKSHEKFFKKMDVIPIGLLYERPVNPELRLLQILQHRSTLDPQQRKKLHYLIAGDRGERLLDNRLAHLDGTVIAIPDLKLRIQQSAIQIDTLIITPSRICLLEIKNFTGDYEITREHQWLSPKQNYIQNPLIQLERTLTAMRQYLTEGGVSVQLLEGFVLFPDPAFTLYGAERTMRNRNVQILSTPLHMFKLSEKRLLYKYSSAHLYRVPLSFSRALLFNTRSISFHRRFDLLSFDSQISSHRSQNITHICRENHVTAGTLKKTGQKRPVC
ncbi:nuclease-related domain-containing protein [Salisediminibacterium halotolerans]|uniref:Nuclease-related domain-containing protein n=1 Tax=Salisediminibacterium halotolerans TaxID=517425 RepID=A0A1H9R924_9BACI|nr:nuclease-related domain-containing protein [Salisediminibacterium haloalkalitolerans]SER69168.1 Nuclease-related domain-containing protein [Salisediminibacterium haloalkalitolerans]